MPNYSTPGRKRKQKTKKVVTIIERPRKNYKTQGFVSDIYNKAKTNYGKPGYMPGLGRTAGTALGGMFGMPGIGGAVGNFLGKITGLGTYKINRNTFISPDPPIVMNSNGNVRIRHREYIQDVASSILFNNQLVLPLNPGLGASFPWLSGIAQNFTQYRFHGLIYEFISTSGSAVSSTNNALGEVMMATNYNAIDTNFVNKQQMLNEEFASSSTPSTNLCHAIECAPRESTATVLYTRSGAIPSGSDQRLYDLGVFQLAVQGQQVGTGQGGATSINLGELYCSYDIEFFKPQLDGANDGGFSVLGAHYNDITSADVSATYPLGQVALKQKYDTIGLVITSTTLTLPAGIVGTWLLTYYVIGSATSTLVPSTVTFTNTVGNVGTKLWQGDTVANVYAPYGGTDNSTTLVYQTAFQIVNSALPTVLTFGTSGTYPATATYMDLILQQIPYSFA